MTAMTVTIPVECPDGYEPLAFRRPEIGELVVDSGTAVRVFEATKGNRPFGPRLIVRLVWQWPDWILPGCWLFRQPGQTRWFVTAPDDEPQESPNGWAHSKSAVWLIDTIMDFTPPPCDDWRTSKRQKPYPTDKPCESGLLGYGAMQAVVTHSPLGVFVGREMEK